MNASKTFSTTNTMNNVNQGLKVTTNYKAGRAASNPSLLNADQMVVSGLKVRTHVMVGLGRCSTVLYSI